MKVLQLAQIVFGINDFKHRATLFFFYFTYEFQNNIAKRKTKQNKRQTQLETKN